MSSELVKISQKLRISGYFLTSQPSQSDQFRNYGLYHRVVTLLCLLVDRPYHRLSIAKQSFYYSLSKSNYANTVMPSYLFSKQLRM